MTAPAAWAEASEKIASLLTPEQQDLFLQLLTRGASPAGACQQVGVSFASYARTLAEDTQFQVGVQEVEVTLGQNVAAALYRAAMQGNVSAQKFWLETRPPPGWSGEMNQPMDSDSFDDLTDDELIDLARAMGIEIPPEIEETSGRSRP